MRLAALLLLAAGLQAQTAYVSNARFKTESEALAYAAEIGVGSARLIGPDSAVVGTYGEFTIRYVVGKAGLAPGGGLRIATAHDFGWDMWGGVRLQQDDPGAPNYLVVRSSTGAPIEWKPYPQGGQDSLFREYHPWQTINQFTLGGDRALSEGDWIAVVYGARAGGSPGVEIQPMDESAFEQKVYVDVFGRGEYLPLAETPSIRVLPAAAKELKVIAQTEWTAGEPGWVNVWLDDGLGNPAISYRGTVQLHPDGASAVEPYSFTAQDEGARRFESIVFPSAGVYRIRATTSDGLQAVSNPVLVHDEPRSTRIVWGDMHTHTKYSDGRGTPQEMFDFGKRYAAIDFCAISDHAFTTTDQMWDDIVATTARMNEPGRYVTFLGYEWSGSSDVGGDHNVYTIDEQMPLIRSYNGYNYRNLRMYHGPNKMAGHVEDLFRMLGEGFRDEDENMLVIPHYGGRRGNPEWHNPKLQRQVEIFSDHRRSEDWASTFLERGHRVGLMASTDNHSGNAGYGVRRIDREVGEDKPLFSRFSPTERGTSLIAVYAEELTRVGVFQGIYHRRTYATTGERIVLRFSAGGESMGGETEVEGPVRLEAAAVGTAGLKTVRLVKNGRIIHAVDPRGDSAEIEFVDQEGAPGGAYYYVDVVQDDGEKAISSPVWVN